MANEYRVPALALREERTTDLTAADVDGNFKKIRDTVNTVSERLTGAVDSDGKVVVPDDSILPKHVKSLVTTYDGETAVELDWSLGAAWKVVVSADSTTITFSNGKAGQAVTVLVVNSSGALNWPTGVQWVNGKNPTPSAAGKVDLYRFVCVAGVYYGDPQYDYGKDYIPPTNRFDYMLAREEKAKGVSMGNAVSGLNIRKPAEIFDPGDNMVADTLTGYITLAAGTYTCRIICPAYGDRHHQAYLMRYVDGTDANDQALLPGTSMKVPQNAITDIDSDGDGIADTTSDFLNTTHSMIAGRFEIAADENPLNRRVYIAHYFAGNDPDGLGKAGNLGPTNGAKEIYTVAEFWRIA